MNDIEDDPAVALARVEVLTWLLTQQFGFYDTDAELVAGFLRFLSQETDLELRTQRNPGACVWEARWSNAGRDLVEFRKPFCAEEEVEARLLACSALIHLDDEDEEPAKRPPARGRDTRQT